jgi:glycosyltransferase involved in cell wall biosynthesis
MLVSPAVPERVAQWRSQWVPSGDKRVVLFAGQLRSDKRLDLLIRTVAKLPRSSWTLAIVGEDKGVEKEMRMLAAALGVKANWHVEYVGLADFSAAVAAADVVVCPYEIASQSGVLALARQLGVPSVACDVGGLGELATITVESDAPSEIAEACVLAVEHSSSDHWEWRQAALDSHLYAYGKAPS